MGKQSINFKLIALDMDGTTCAYMGKLVSENIEPIIEAQTKGIKTIFATGRPPLASLPDAKTLQMNKYSPYIVAFNGACVMDINTKQITFANAINSHLVKQVFTIGQEEKVDLWCYTSDLNLVVANFDYTTSIENEYFKGEFKIWNDVENIEFSAFKFLAFNVTNDSAFVKKVRGLNIEVAVDAKNHAEVNAPNIGKHVGLAWICDKWNIKSNEVIAMGDSANDYSMIKWAGLGVAMDNAQEEVKKIADYVSEPNFEAAVGKTISKFVLNELNITKV